MRKVYLTLAGIFLSTLMQGCLASGGDVDFLYSRQRDTETALKKTQEDVERLKAEVLSEYEEDSLNLKETIFKLESKFLELEQVLAKLYERIGKIEKGVEEPTTDAPKSHYELGQKKFAEGDYESARKAFREHIDTNPGDENISEAMFLIADSFFKDELYEESVLECQNMIESWPESPRIPLCQLNQGLALKKINKPEEAKLFFKLLIEAHPESKEAEEARNQLKQLTPTALESPEE